MDMQTYIDLVQMRVTTERGDDAKPARVDDIEAMFPLVAKEFALNAVLPSREKRRIFAKTYTISSSDFDANGVLDLTAPTFADILAEGLPFATIIISGYAESLAYKTTRRDLLSGSVHPDYGRYTIESDSLVTRANATTPIDTSTTGTIYDAIYVPASPTDIPARVIEEFISYAAMKQLERIATTAQVGGAT